MQFNRNEYLAGNFDLDDMDERKNAYYAQEKKGLDWNNYIKDYFKRCIGDAIGTFDYPWQLVQPFANLGPFIDFGLFNQGADYLETLITDNDEFNANRDLWIARLRSADDYAYQKSINPNYKTFTIDQMMKDGTIANYLKKTGKNEEDFEDDNKKNNNKKDKNDSNTSEILSEAKEKLKKYKDGDDNL